VRQANNLAAENNKLQSEQKKPRYFYGYIIVASSFVLMLLTFGINYSFGVFLGPLLLEFSSTTAATSGVFSMLTIISGFFGIFAGKLNDTIGPKVLSIVTGLSMAIGFILMSVVTTIWQTYLVYGLLISLGIGSVWPILMPTISRWFVLRRGLMVGIVTAGTGIGTAAISLLANYLITAYDWRAAYAVIGIGSLVIVVIASLLLKKSPAEIGLLPYGEEKRKSQSSTRVTTEYSFRDSVRTRNFAVLLISFLFFGITLFSVMVHIVKHTTHIGISAADSAMVLAIIGISNCLARVGMGSVSDRIGSRLTLIIGFAVMAVSLIWLQIAGELWMFYLFALVFGFAYGNILAGLALAPAEFFGLGSLGVIMGTILFSYTIGGAVGPIVTGYLFDKTGNYSLAFLIITIVSVIGCILVGLLRPQVMTPKVVSMKQPNGS